MLYKHNPPIIHSHKPHISQTENVQHTDETNTRKENNTFIIIRNHKYTKYINPPPPPLVL